MAPFQASGKSLPVGRTPVLTPTAQRSRSVVRTNDWPQDQPARATAPESAAQRRRLSSVGRANGKGPRDGADRRTQVLGPSPHDW